MNADSGQGQLFRSYLVSAPAAYAMAFGSLAAFTLGAWQGSVAVMLGGPALIVLAVVAIAWICRGPRGRERLLLPLRVLCGAGLCPPDGPAHAHSGPRCRHRRHAEQWMYGRLPGGLTGGVGQFVWEVVDEDSESIGSRAQPLHALRGGPRPVAPVLPRRLSAPAPRAVAPYSDWLGRTPVRRVEVESTRVRRALRPARGHRPGRVDAAPAAVSEGRQLAGQPPA